MEANDRPLELSIKGDKIKQQTTVYLFEKGNFKKLVGQFYMIYIQKQKELR